MTPRLRRPVPALALVVSTCALMAAVALALAPAPASAAWVPADTIDGPSPGVGALGGVDVARDGTGGVTYLKTDAGAAHVFASRLLGGGWTAPQRLDAGQPAPSSAPVLSAVNEGMLVAAWINGGAVWAAWQPAGGAFGPPELVYAPPAGYAARTPALDVSVHGAAYLAFTVTNGTVADVRLAYRRSGPWALAPGAVDIDPGRPAGLSGGRPKVAAAGEGVAVVVWGEVGADGRSRVYERRARGTTLSAAPAQASVDSLDGRPGGDADVPEVAVGFDSSFAAVAFRQRFADGASTAVRGLARWLVGSAFEAPFAADGQGFPAAEPAAAPKVAVEGGGVGAVLGGRDGSGQVVEVPIGENKADPAVRVDALGGAPPLLLAPAIGDNEDGPVAWLRTIGPGAAEVRARYREKGRLEPEVVLSSPALGSVEGDLGLDAGVDRQGNSAVAFVQGGPGARRIAVAQFDNPPGIAVPTVTRTWQRRARPALQWERSNELWGAVTYRVLLDEQVLGTTAGTRFVPPVRIPDGRHLWRVLGVDRRGQTSANPSHPLLIDTTAPHARLSVRRKGRAVRVRIRASDRNRGVRVSGISRIRIAFGDGAVATGARAIHRYGRGGRRTITVRVSDKAHNVTRVKRKIALGS